MLNYYLEPNLEPPCDEPEIEEQDDGDDRYENLLDYEEYQGYLHVQGL